MLLLRLLALDTLDAVIHLGQHVVGHDLAGSEPFLTVVILDRPGERVVRSALRRKRRVPYRLPAAREMSPISLSAPLLCAVMRTRISGALTGF